MECKKCLEQIEIIKKILDEKDKMIAKLMKEKKKLQKENHKLKTRQLSLEFYLN